jgi:long-subunit acyl-CoA synthetase (AMP-forming)
MGYIDDDGYLFLHGRKKNLIITAYGRNFSPEWAESELTAYPSIQQAVVFGDAQPFNVAIIFAAPGVNPAYLNQVVKQANERLHTSSAFMSPSNLALRVTA